MRTLAIIILALAFFPQQPEAQEESNLVAIICGIQESSRNMIRIQ